MNLLANIYCCCCTHANQAKLSQTASFCCCICTYIIVILKAFNIYIHNKSAISLSSWRPVDGSLRSDRINIEYLLRSRSKQMGGNNSRTTATFRKFRCRAMMMIIICKYMMQNWVRRAWSRSLERSLRGARSPFDIYINIYTKYNNKKKHECVIHIPCHKHIVVWLLLFAFRMYRERQCICNWLHQRCGGNWINILYYSR